MTDSNLPPTERQCKTCCKPESNEHSLKQCSHCKSTVYCSRECQKADWKAHKKICGSIAQSNATTDTGTNAETSTTSAAPDPRLIRAGRNRNPRPVDAARSNSETPFCKLFSGKWLHDRPEQEVYELLIDVYRLRMEDTYNLFGVVDKDSIHGGVTDGGISGFRRFLGKVERRPGLLPEWWTSAKANKCVALGSTGPSWAYLADRVEKQEIIQHYGNCLMPMLLRMFGEQVYGTSPGGRNDLDESQIR